ncbi:DUF1440 domain-containing protein [Permianibacter sp. IMCC34836]|uniref:DUF1440 domain-containing protein n=1 Tax=Permianibacter fluminis TaxID=2738515 RepID=UPI001551F99D|nr:DUF1440 domain-containing protein [Permianibacter fluminis]NQD36239.1 DUF1440 domain-containing protein [Permianibacter fluminis]
MKENELTFQSWLVVIVLAGLLAGTLDITAAIGVSALRGVEPLRLLQSVASGWLGKDAYDGGLATAMLGLLLHYLIMQGVAAVFYLGTVFVDGLSRKPLLFGPLYGITVYAVMNAVVLPLSAFPNTIHYSAQVLATGLTIHMLCIGLPIVILISRFRMQQDRLQA